MLWIAGARNGPTSNLMESRRCGLLFRRLFLYGITFAPHPPITSRSLNSKLQNSGSLFQWIERLNKASIKSKTSSCLQFVDRYCFFICYLLFAAAAARVHKIFEWWLLCEMMKDIRPRCEGENEKIFQIKTSANVLTHMNFHICHNKHREIHALRHIN